MIWLSCLRFLGMSASLVGSEMCIRDSSTRIKILYALFESEMCVCDIAQLLNMTQSAISHQLRSLKQSKLVKYRREGKTVFYSLADAHVRTIINQGLEHVEE